MKEGLYLHKKYDFMCEVSFDCFNPFPWITHKVERASLHFKTNRDLCKYNNNNMSIYDDNYDYIGDV